jgi:hypothetical protein
MCIDVLREFVKYSSLILAPLRQAVDCMSDRYSAAECERSFSAVNDIASDICSLLI